jgi:hypothetical protein
MISHEKPSLSPDPFPLGPFALLLCQAPFHFLSPQLSENTPKIPARNFADHFPLPAHTQTMSTNSKHASRARDRIQLDRSQLAEFHLSHFQGPQPPRVQLKSVHSAGSAVAKITKAVIFPTKKHKSIRNSFVINKSIQIPRRFFAIFIDFCARKGHFLPPKSTPARAFISVSCGSMGSCFPTLRQFSEMRILRLPSSATAATGRSG